MNSAQPSASSTTNPILVIWQRLLAWFQPRGGAARELKVVHFGASVAQPTAEEQAATVRGLFAALPGLRRLAERPAQRPLAGVP